MRVRVDDLEKDKELLKSALQDSPLLHSTSLIWPFSHLHDRSMARSRSARSPWRTVLLPLSFRVIPEPTIRAVARRTSSERPRLLGSRWRRSWRWRKPLESSRRPHNLLESAASLKFPHTTGRVDQPAEAHGQREGAVEGRGGSRTARIENQTWKKLHARSDPRSCT